MNLKELSEAVERLRASGTHPLTEVVIADGLSIIGVEGIDGARGRVCIHPDYGAEPVGVQAEDDE